MARALLSIACFTQWLACSRSPINICWIVMGTRVHEKGCYVIRHLCNTYSSCKDPLHFQGGSLGLGGQGAVGRACLLLFSQQFQWQCPWWWIPRHVRSHWWAHLYATASFKRHLSNRANHSCCKQADLGIPVHWAAWRHLLLQVTIQEKQQVVLQSYKRLFHPRAVIGNTDKEGAQSHHLWSTCCMPSMSLGVLNALPH